MDEVLCKLELSICFHNGKWGKERWKYIVYGFAETLGTLPLVLDKDAGAFDAPAPPARFAKISEPVAHQARFISDHHHNTHSLSAFLYFCNNICHPILGHQVHVGAYNVFVIG